MYIDQIELGNETPAGAVKSAPQLLEAKGFEKHVDIMWTPVKDTRVKYVKIYRSADNQTFYPVGIQSPRTSRYADFTGTTGKKFFYKIALLDEAYNESTFSTESERKYKDDDR
jgi:fibronectin type 3 domain-containing protein